MKIVLSLFSLTALFVASCNKVETLEETPRCIQKEIADYEELEGRDNPLSVWRYTYNGQTVYFFPQGGCCDKASILLDEECEHICNPDGGFSGSGDGRCTDFFTARRDEVLVWKNNK